MRKSGAAPQSPAADAASGTARLVRIDISDPGSAQARDLEIELDRGHVYHAMVGSAPVREHIIERLVGMPIAAVVPANGGLIGNLKVWENLVLPVAYHGAPRYDELETRAAEALAEFGISGAKFASISAELPDHLDRFERRLCAFVRALLTEPRLMVYDSLFDGLTREETGKVVAFDRAYHRRMPGGTSLHLTADLPTLPDLGAYRTFHL